MAINNQLAPRQDTSKPKVSISAYLNTEVGQRLIQNTIKDQGAAQKLTANLITLASVVSGLKDCEPSTIIGAGFQAFALNLPINNQLGFCYVLPYKDNKRNVVVAQFLVGYKGFTQLAIRTGQIKNINVFPVKQGDIEYYNAITGEIRFVDNVDEEKRELAETIGYYADITLTSGFFHSLYWTKQKVMNHAKTYSKAYGSGYSFWDKNFDAMGMKTLLKQLLSKWSPMTTELAQALKVDQAVVSNNEKLEYLDNPNNKGAIDLEEDLVITPNLEKAKEVAMEKAKEVKEKLASSTNKETQETKDGDFVLSDIADLDSF